MRGVHGGADPGHEAHDDRQFRRRCRLLDHLDADAGCGGRTVGLARYFGDVKRQGGPVARVRARHRADQQKDGGAVVVFSDITERRRAEARLQFTQGTVDNAADPIYWVGLDRGQIVYANHAASRALGFSRDELMTMTLGEIDPYATATVMASARDTLRA
ncbi:MAG: PAS domain-containing protein, partial [Alphaproteobacteria bacterium]|nr:PAS domain-containing protein [Alphaproteobacteria bacterium]